MLLRGESCIAVVNFYILPPYQKMAILKRHIIVIGLRRAWMEHGDVRG